MTEKKTTDNKKEEEERRAEVAMMYIYMDRYPEKARAKLRKSATDTKSKDKI